MHTILPVKSQTPKTPKRRAMRPGEWQEAAQQAGVAARRIPAAEWHTEAKLERPGALATYPTIPQLNYTWQHFIEVGTYDKRDGGEVVVYLGADGELYTPTVSPVDFMLLPQKFIDTAAAQRLIGDLSRFYKLSDEHDRLYAAIIAELERISDWRLFARVGVRYYADVYTEIHRVGDESRRLFRSGGEAEYLNHLRINVIETLDYLIDEKGRLVRRSRHTGRLTVVEPCEIFESSELRSLLKQLRSIQ